MPIELTVAIVVAVIVPAIIIVLRLIFKRSIIVSITIPYLVTIAVIGYLVFVIGLRGIVHLFWAIPLGLAVFSGSIFIIKKQLYDPIKKIENKLRDISEGEANLSQKLSIASKNEIGLLAGYCNKFGDKLAAIIVSLGEVSEKNKSLSGNLAATSEETSSTTQQIRATIESMDEKVAVLKSEIDSASTAMNTINEYNIKVNRLIEEQASAVSESSSSIQEMLSSLSMIEKNTEIKKQSSDELVQFAKKGENTIKDTFNRITEIAESTELISGMLGVINTVAAQTKLLGMNAAIEAAHAGEYGRGFGIVADEIRKLAEATSKNAKDITKSLKSIIEKIKAASHTSTETGALIGRIVGGIGDISESMAETLFGIKEINMGTKQITDALTSLLTLSEDVRASSNIVIKGTNDIENSMKSIAGIATENKQGMSEISHGMSEIADSSVLLAEMSTENTANVFKMETEIGKFRLEGNAS